MIYLKIYFQVNGFCVPPPARRPLCRRSYFSFLTCRCLASNIIIDIINIIFIIDIIINFTDLIFLFSLAVVSLVKSLSSTINTTINIVTIIIANSLKIRFSLVIVSSVVLQSCHDCTFVQRLDVPSVLGASGHPIRIYYKHPALLFFLRFSMQFNLRCLWRLPGIQWSTKMMKAFFTIEFYSILGCHGGCRVSYLDLPRCRVLLSSWTGCKCFSHNSHHPGEISGIYMKRRWMQPIESLKTSWLFSSQEEGISTEVALIFLHQMVADWKEKFKNDGILIY